MDALEAILSRRSIRKFKNEVISDEGLEVLLKAGFSAPSAHNRQPWEFIVLKDQNILSEIGNKHPYGKMLPQAGCGIFVCGDSENQKDSGFLIADCSAAIENILIAAHALNLGAVWCGLHPKKELEDMSKELLNLPEHIVPVGLIAVGPKDDEKPPRDNYDVNKIHYNKW